MSCFAIDIICRNNLKDEVDILEFRKDINGLRAIAVLPVLFFHAGVKGFDGGFLGVDVFFVISGFLITSNIITEQLNGKFSLLGFYDKRARRILPPLILTLLLTLLLSFIFMLPYELKNLGQSIVATSLGANNILLYLTSGYWSLAAEFKPLYHTWSLGVEEQYYFIVPIIFITFLKKQKLLITSILTLFLISLISSYTIENKEFNFLMILTRFWELCAGSLLAMYMKKNTISKSSALSFIGLTMIMLSYWSPYILSSNQVIVNLMPVLGTSLMIAFTKPNSLTYRMLSQKLMMIIGFSSYSIYLFHQPILSFLRLATEGEVEVYKQLLFSLISIPLGYLSWKFVETPFRSKQNVPNKIFYTLTSLLILLLICVGFFLHKSYGMHKFSFFSKYSYGNNPQVYADRAFALRKDRFSTAQNKMLIIGNSFARDFYNALEEQGVLNDYEVIYLDNYYKDTKSSRLLMKSADIITWVSSSGLANTLISPQVLKTNAMILKNELTKYSNGNYYYIGTKNFGFNNNFIKHMDWNDSLNYMVKINPSNILADKIESEVFSDRYISLLSLLKNGNKIRVFTEKHQFISFDTEHTTKAGAIYLGEKILSSTPLRKLKNQSKSIPKE